MIVKDQKTVL